MARLFTYGRLNDINTIPNKNALPGTLVGAWGANLVSPAYKGADTVEFGEIVAIDQVENAKGYKVSRLVTGTTAGKLGIIVRDVVGANFVGAGIVEAPKDTVPLSVIPLVGNVYFPVVGILASSQTPAVGGKVYVGKGTGSAVAGAIYTSAQGGGSDSLDTGWVFASLKFKPTTGAGEAVQIAKAL